MTFVNSDFDLIDDRSKILSHVEPSFTHVGKFLAWTTFQKQMIIM